MSDNTTNTARITPEGWQSVYGAIGAALEQFYAGGRKWTLFEWTRGKDERAVYVEWILEWTLEAGADREGDIDRDNYKDSGALDGVFADIEAARAAVYADLLAGGR